MPDKIKSIPQPIVAAQKQEYLIECEGEVFKCGTLAGDTVASLVIGKNVHCEMDINSSKSEGDNHTFKFICEANPGGNLPTAVKRFSLEVKK